MSKNRKLARSILDSGLSEFRRQITYKCEKNGTGLVIADKWFPSTQICSVCGDRHPMKLSDRIYECHKCGTIINRDLNAAINLSTVGTTETKACGQEGSDFKHMFVVKPAWMKQELNRIVLS